MNQPRNIKGKTYNQLTALEFVDFVVISKMKRARWKWRCICGKEFIAPSKQIVTGHRLTCGCGTNRPQCGRRYTGVMAVAYQIYSNHSYRDIRETVSFEEFCIMIAQPCFYCGAAPNNVQARRRGIKFTYQGLDRIDNEQGHSKSNVVSCCFKCNDRKSNDRFDSFIQWVKTVYEKLELQHLQV